VNSYHSTAFTPVSNRLKQSKSLLPDGSGTPFLLAVSRSSRYGASIAHERLAAERRRFYRHRIVPRHIASSVNVSITGFEGLDGP